MDIIENKMIELNTKLYDLPSYEDKNGNKIDFNIFFFKTKEESCLTQLILQASVNNEVAGYISLLYLSEENKKTYFNSPWDFYYNQKMPVHLKHLFNNDWTSFCNEIKNSYMVDILSKEDFKVFATNNVNNEYKKFISYYLNKPYPEIVTVYSDDDKNCKDFSEFPFMNIKRKATNFLGQGIANAIYHCACQVLKKENMSLYASNNQTADGQRMWKQLEKNPKFLTLSDSYWGSLTTDRKNIIEVQRKSLTI